MKLENSISNAIVFIFIFLNGWRIASAMESEKSKDSKTDKAVKFDKTDSKIKGNTLSRWFRSSKSIGTTSMPTHKSQGHLELHDVSDPTVFLSNMTQLPVIQGDDWSLRLEVEGPSDDNKDVIDQAKKELIELLNENKALTVPLGNEAWLLRFLRLKDYKAADAYKLIQKYYQLKVDQKKIFEIEAMNPTTLLSIVEKDMFTIMAKRDQWGRRIFIFRATYWDPEKFAVIDLLKTLVRFIEASAYEPTTQIAGVEAIIDLKDFTFTQAIAINEYAKLIMEYVQSCSPMRIVKFHIVNQPTWINIIVPIFRPFVTDIMHGKAIYHGTKRDKLFEEINSEYLPGIYDGTAPLPSIDRQQWEVILDMGNEEYKKIISYGLNDNQLPTSEPKASSSTPVPEKGRNTKYEKASHLTLKKSTNT